MHILITSIIIITITVEQFANKNIRKTNYNLIYYTMLKIKIVNISSDISLYLQ